MLLRDGEICIRSFRFFISNGRACDLFKSAALKSLLSPPPAAICKCVLVVDVAVSQIPTPVQWWKMCDTNHEDAHKRW